MDVKLISSVRRVCCSREHVIDGSHSLYFSTYAKEKSEREERDGGGGNFLSVHSTIEYEKTEVAPRIAVFTKGNVV